MLNLNIFSEVIRQVIRKFKVYSHKVKYNKFQFGVSQRMCNKKYSMRII